MITGGVVVLAFVTYQLFGTTLAEQHAQSQLQQRFNAQVTKGGQAAPSGGRTTGGSSTGGGSKSSGAGSGGAGSKSSGAGSGGADNPTVGSPRSISPSVPSGVAVDHLVIPKIAVNKYVVQGTAEGDLTQGPGHYIGTPFPGQKGNAAIAGHRTTYGAPFFQLNNLVKGDPIYLTSTSGRIFVYRVASRQVVSPSDSAVLDNTKTARLTLTTCNPRFSATSRLVVVADLVGHPSVAAPISPATPHTHPASRSTSGAKSGAGAAPAANLGRGNSNGWPPAIAYGAAFVVLWIGARLAINRTRRSTRLAAFVIGIVVCAVPLWFCFENVVRLLPQSI